MDADSNPQERLRRHLLGRLVLEVPDAVAVGQGLEVHAAFRLDADLRRDGVTTRPRLARRRSDGRVDGVEAPRRRSDAIAAILTSSTSMKTLSQHFKAAHVEQQVGIIFRIDAHEGVLPLARRERSR